MRVVGQLINTQWKTERDDFVVGPSRINSDDKLAWGRPENKIQKFAQHQKFPSCTAEEVYWNKINNTHMLSFSTHTLFQTAAGLSISFFLLPYRFSLASVLFLTPLCARPPSTRLLWFALYGLAAISSHTRAPAAKWPFWRKMFADLRFLIFRLAEWPLLWLDCCQPGGGGGAHPPSMQTLISLFSENFCFWLWLLHPERLQYQVSASVFVLFRQILPFKFYKPKLNWVQ